MTPFQRCAAAIVLLVAGLAFFYPLLTGDTFSTVGGHQSAVYPWHAYPTGLSDYPQSDQADLSYPWQAYLTRSLAAGEWPWWNPYSFAGQPISSNGSSAMLYPPRVLAALFLSPSWAHDLLSLMHVLLGGWFMYLLLTEFGALFPGAVFAALAWMLNSFTFAWLHLEVVAPVFTFLPLAVFCVLRASRTRSWGWTAITSVIFGVLLSAGHLPFMGVTLMVPAVYAASLGLLSARRLQRARDGHAAMLEMLRPCVTIALALGVAAVVILPTLYTIAESQRQVLRYEDVHESIRLTWSDLRYLLYPPPLPVTEVTMHRMAFSGTATLLLAVIGALLPGAGAWFGRVLGVVVVLVVLDLGLLRVLYWVLPAFSVFRPLGRLLFLLNFAVAVLAGLGLDRLWRWAKEPHMPATILRRWPGIEAWLHRSRGEIFGGVGVAVVIVCFLTSFELISYARGINPPFHARQARNLYPVTPLIAAISGAARKAAAPERLLPIVRSSTADLWHPPTLYAAEPLVFGIEALTGYDSVIPQRSLQVLRVVMGEPVADVLANPYTASTANWAYVNKTRFELLNRVGVTLVAGSPDIDLDPDWCPAACAQLEPLYAGADGKVFRVRGATAGPWLSYMVQGVDTDSQALLALADPAVDVRRSVILENGQIPPDYPRTSLTGAGIINVVEKSNNHLLVKLSSTEPGWLVVPDTYDPGWQATVNGNHVPLLRANYAYRAVQVPAGTSEVRMRYIPQGFTVGAAISGAALSGCFALVVVDRLRTRRLRRRGRATHVAAPGHRKES